MLHQEMSRRLSDLILSIHQKTLVGVKVAEKYKMIEWGYAD